MEIKDRKSQVKKENSQKESYISIPEENYIIMPDDTMTVNSAVSMALTSMDEGIAALENTVKEMKCLKEKAYRAAKTGGLSFGEWNKTYVAPVTGPLTKMEDRYNDAVKQAVERILDKNEKNEKGKV